jgi:hypothetical protein
MKKVIAIAAAVALLLTPAVVWACSVHGSIAANDIQNYINGGTSNYGNGRSDEMAQGLRQFSVWGSQEGDWADGSRTYWVTLTSPFGESVTFSTTWGQMPDGWAIENLLSDSGIQWIENWFDAHFGTDGQLIDNPDAVGASQQNCEEHNS